MNTSLPPVIQQMDVRIRVWETAADRKAIFLRCYQMMTSNTLAAIESNGFADPPWVNGLLHRFADYYFDALTQYEAAPALAPRVWQLAHDAAQNPAANPLQLLLLGVNAHINYDLVLTLVDILEADWPGLSEAMRSTRYQDHCKVNQVIGETIDAVQDQVLEPAMPGMAWVDTLFGRVDEYLLSRLITNWRESVWQHAVQLMEISEPRARRAFITQIEANSLRLGKLIF